MEKLCLPTEFLKLPVWQWSMSDSYNRAKALIDNLAVTNDHAERGVALAKEYAGKITKDEEQLQFALQVVSDHRKRFPVASKRALMFLK